MIAIAKEYTGSRSFLFQSAGIVAILTVASRLLGFVRDSALADKFGATTITDAYNMGLNIPSILFAAVNTALSTTFIPVFTRVRQEKGLDSAFRTSNIVINFTLLIALFLVLVEEIFAVPIVHLVAPGFHGPKLLLTAYLTRLMFPMIIFQMLSGVFTGMLQSMYSFSLPAMIGMISNAIIIFSILVPGPVYGIQAVAIANTISLFVTAFVQLPALYKLGFRWRLVFDWQDPGFIRISRLVVPILIGSAVGQVGLLIDRMLASGLSVGSITTLNFANRLTSLPGGTLGLAVISVMYPTFAAHIASGNRDNFKSVFNESIRFINYLLFPMMVFLIVLRYPIIQLSFQHGKFNASATGMTAFALLFFSLGIVTGSVRDMTGRAFWSQQNTLTPMIIGASSVLVNIALDFILIHPLKLGGLALATSTAALVNSTLLILTLKKQLGNIGGRLLISSFWRVAASSAVTGLVSVWFFNVLLLVLPGMSILHQFIRLLLTALIATGVYLFLTLLLRLPETLMLFRLVKKNAG